MNVTVTFKEYEEMILSKKIVDAIFEEADTSVFFNGKVVFTVNDYLLKKLFPERYEKTKLLIKQKEVNNNV